MKSTAMAVSTNMKLMPRVPKTYQSGSKVIRSTQTHGHGDIYVYTSL
jgi:hypothetical protein